MRALLLGLVFPSALAGVLGSGCSLITASDCVSIGVTGIQLTAVDRRTNQTPAGTVVTATDGAYTETLMRSGAVYLGAAERPGTYMVVVDSPGYVRWIRENVSVVRRGPCNALQPAVLTSELLPSG